jgi:hypothetical protein
MKKRKLKHWEIPFYNKHWYDFNGPIMPSPYQRIKWKEYPICPHCHEICKFKTEFGIKYYCSCGKTIDPESVRFIRSTAYCKIRC